MEVPAAEVQRLRYLSIALAQSIKRDNEVTMTEPSATSTFSQASQSSLNNSDDADEDESLGVDMDADSVRTGNRSNKSDINAENINLKNEAKKTSVIRCLVITTLLTVAAIVANVALIMALNEQEVAFKTEYTRLSNRVIEHFFYSLEQRISAADSVVSQMNFQGNDLPYLVTIPYFERHAEGIRQLSTSMTLSYAPIIRGQEQRIEFEKYADSAYNETSRSSFKSHYLPNNGKYNFEDKPLVTFIDTDGRSVDQGIFRIEGNNVVDDNISVIFAPIWQVAPFNSVTNTTIMFNQMTEEHRRSALEKLLDSSGFVVSDIFYGSTSDSLHSAYAAPVFALYYPAAKDIVNNKSRVVGVMTLEIALESLLEGALYGMDEEPITAVIETSCGSQYSFEVRGEQVIFLGNGSLREVVPDVGAYELVSSNYTQFNNLIQSFSGIYPTSDEALCSYQLSTYPTNDFYDYYLTSRPLMVEGLVGLVFLFTVTVFLGYDCLVERRQRRVLAAAQRTNALVGSLFPQAVRDRLYKQAAKTHGHLEAAPKLRLKNFMIHDQNEAETPELEIKGNAGEPIADLFPEASVLFADISGFSAWASERQPSEVFTLLETFFTSFDTLARRLGIFKVETVGDCYVAASGIPQARADHAVAMVRFANAMMLRANELAKGLESTLGPGTGDLTIRVGIHSGPVTAGVLRGEKSRFQLFGDTMNSASRIQSTSHKGKVQLSTETANLLIESGKAHWIEPREDLVEAKGKGTIQTYWLRIGGKDEGGRDSGSALQRSIVESHESKERLIDWSVTTMMGLVERIVASRGKRRGSRSDKDADVSLRPTHWNVLEEVHEVVELARFDSQAVLRSDSRGTISPVVRSELRDFISQISSLYLDNPFHNFSHASHVTMSCHKLLKRINRPEEVNYSNVNMADVAQELHDATYGISSDPLTQLAIVFSALIHDAGHQGVPNGQLAKENPQFVAKYGNQSLAEQRSLDISLELLEAPCYSNLRACIMPTKGEQERFRQIIINCVLATDIFDRDLGAMRKARWAKAFGRDPQATEDEDTRAMDRKATIVLEHVIQASDVAHTMQHWKIYIKWNENLYREMYKAYKEGRSDKDPTEGWYKGELWFFDNYIIPLAKKLKECGVFGISSDEYLHYAQENRSEWEEKGEEIVAKMEKRMKEPVVGKDGDDEFQVDRRSSFGSSLGISSHGD